MEETKPVEQSNLANIYWNRLAFFGGSSAILTGLLSAILLMKFRRGLVLGLGIGAGYCHNDLRNMIKSAQK